MKLEKLNHWLTFVANFGVIGGLVFLGYETQQNTLQLRAEASYSINEALSMMNSGIYNDPIMANIKLRGEADLSSLTPTALQQFIAHQFDRINLAIHVLALEEEGLSDIHFPYIDFLVDQYHENPGLQEFLVLVKDNWKGSEDLYDMLRRPSG